MCFTIENNVLCVWRLPFLCTISIVLFIHDEYKSFGTEIRKFADRHSHSYNFGHLSTTTFVLTNIFQLHFVNHKNQNPMFTFFDAVSCYSSTGLWEWVSVSRFGIFQPSCQSNFGCFANYLLFLLLTISSNTVSFLSHESS